MSNKKTLQPNRLQLAIAELNGIIKSSDVPTTINVGEAGGYVFIGIKSSDNQSGTAKIHKGKMLYAPISKYEYMKKHTIVFGGLFNGMFNQLVLLHDPTIPVVEPKKEVKDLSPKQKKAVNDLMEEGKGQDDEGLKEIAEQVGVSFERVKAYIQSF